ncbi:MAG: bifunctional aldolase/short-chain dehydrogenase [Desulfobulbaceae bacterium]|nr:bifunctional aldolase/short-chain dehydrogenase [Desulfobulbaceae bacterium]
MKNRYDQSEAQQYINRYPEIPEDVALRVYTSRIIGKEADLVLHGGGNTSVKTEIKNILGESVEAIFIKGSGWDLSVIEPQGFPALDLNYLRKLRVLEELSDEEMVNQFRTHLLDASSPNPSIETLVHAFLPYKFIDHSHADAIVALTNQEKADEHIQKALGDKAAILPFIMPGFPLAQKTAELFEKNPHVECIILKNHGIFTFGDDAQSAYDNMIKYVTMAEDYLAEAAKQVEPVERVEIVPPDPAVIMPILRGALNRGLEEEGDGFYLQLRDDAAIREVFDRVDAVELLVSGVLTPDHVIRTKNLPVFLDFSWCDTEETIRNEIETALGEYSKAYETYFTTQVEGKGVSRTMLDTMPRVFMVRGLGLITAGRSMKDVRIAADIAEHTISTKVQGSCIGSYAPLADESIFDMEYWSLEQVKLGTRKMAHLQSKVALVTGGGGAIAVGIGRQLLKAGACVVLTDVDQERLQRVEQGLAAEFGSDRLAALHMDVTNELSVENAFRQTATLFGGVDVVVPNAGLAHVAKLADLVDEDFQRVTAVNMFGVFKVIKGAEPLLRRQNTGGDIIVNSSKNVFSPGASFGAYSASKAGAHQLGKIAALEMAEIGVRVNMINADAIFDAGEVSSGLWDVVGPDRMRSRNLDPEGLKEYYRQRNLLKSTVTADHVGNAVVFFAAGFTPTTGATLPVDGGVPDAFPR